MKKSDLPKLGLALVLLAGAVFCFVKLRPASDQKENGYFYDLATQTLFVAPRSAIPPIPGPKSKELTGVRAVVISTNGNPADAASRRIAYLEKYSPELKAVLEDFRAGKTKDVPGHQQRQDQIFVKRLQDDQWYTIKSPEGEKIVTGWNLPGPDGKYPTVCSP